jgi:hypothetical protein
MPMLQQPELFEVQFEANFDNDYQFSGYPVEGILSIFHRRSIPKQAYWLALTSFPFFDPNINTAMTSDFMMSMCEQNLR